MEAIDYTREQTQNVKVERLYFADEVIPPPTAPTDLWWFSWYTAIYTVNTHMNTPNTYALLIEAVERNDLVAVKSLVQRMKVVPDYALDTAIERNWVDQVAVLAPKSDRRMRNIAMAEACNMRRADVVDVLYPLCDVPKVLSILDKHSGPHIEIWKTTLLQRWDADKLHETLMAEVAVPTLSTSRKM